MNRDWYYIGALVLIIALFLITGCTQSQPRPIFVPVKSNAVSADCIIKNPNGSASLAVCPKPLNWDNI